MSHTSTKFLIPAKPSEVRMLGASLVDQLLKVEDELPGPDQIAAKQRIIAHFEQNEPDLFPFFRSNAISPYQLLAKVQKAFESQSDVTLGDYTLTKRDAVDILKRYIPNLQYLHDRQLYTRSDTLKDLGASMAIGVGVIGLTEAVGRNFVSNPYLSMEMAVFGALSIGLLVFLFFLGSKNRNFFHKAPWNSAIYLGANLQETDPENWEAVTWKKIQQPFQPTQGFTVFKSRPHYEALDAACQKTKKFS